MSLSSSIEDITETHSRKVIQMGFSLVVLIIIFIVVLGLVRLSKTQDSLNKIIGTEQAAVEMLFHMQQTSRARSITLYRISSTQDAFERDELMQQYSDLGAQFGEYRRKLSELNLDSHEKEMLAQQREHILNTMNLQQQVIDFALAGNMREAQYGLNKEAIPAQERILESINTLLAHEIADSHTLAEQIQEQQLQTRFLMLAAGLLGTFFAVLIASFVNRRMKNMISVLSSSRQRLQESNLSLESLKLAMDQHNIVSIANVEGKITYANDKFCQVSEYSMAEIIGY